MLHKLVPAGKDRKRVGRGGSRGGTSGRGGKGQKGRSGPGIGIHFEGGQMPLTRRMPKRGFNNARFRKQFTVITLDMLQNHFEADAVVNAQALVDAGLISAKQAALLKVLATGSLDKKMTVHVDAISKAAHDTILRVGGQVIMNQKAA